MGFKSFRVLERKAGVLRVGDMGVFEFWEEDDKAA